MSRTILFPPQQAQATGWRSAIARWITRSRWEGPLTASSPEIARLFDDGAKNTSGVPVNESNALTYSAIWAAVTLISSQIASLPLILYKRLPNGGKERYTGHQVYRLLHDEPNPEMTSMVFRETLMAHVLTWGNAYAEIERDQLGRPIALWPLLPYQVYPYRDEVQRLRYRVSTPNQPDVVLLPHEILHVPGLGFDGIVGYSVIRMAAESIGLGLATRRFGASFFGQGSTFGGILSHPNKLSTDAKDNLRASVESLHRGPERAHRFLILQEGMNYHKLGVDPDSAQFLETRQFEIAEIARWFNIPPHKLRDLLRATFSNIEQQSIEFVTDTLRPWMVRWEQEINRKLISRPERNLQFVEHLVEGLLRGDIASRYAAYAVGRQWGWLSANDVRERENLNPLPGDEGNIYMVPMNMTTPAKMLAEPVPPGPQPPEPTPGGDAADDGDDARHQALVDEIRAMQRQWERLSEAIAAQEAHLHTISAMREDREALERNLAAEIDKSTGPFQEWLREEMKVRAHEVRSLAEAISTAQAAAERWAAERSTLERSIAEKQAELEAAEAQRIAGAAAAEAEQQRVAAEHAERVSRIQADADEARSALEVVRVSEGAAQAALDEATSAHAQEIEARTAEVSRLRSEFDEAIRQREAQANADRQAWEDARSTLLSDQETEASALSTQLEDAQRALDVTRQERDALTVAIEEWRAQAGASAEDASQRLAALTADVQSREAVVSELREAHARLVDEHAEAVSKRDAEHESELAEIRREREAREAEIAERIALAEQHIEEARQSHVAQREAAEASIRELQDALAAATARADQHAEEAARLKADIAQETDARTAAEARAVSVATARQDQDAAVLAAHRALVVETMRRMIEREADRARRAQATPQKLRAWIETFYPAHEDLCRTALLPVVRIHLAWIGSDEDPASVAEALSHEHVGRSIADLRGVLDEDPEDFGVTLHGVLHRWETERSQVIADSLFQKELAYARRRS